MTRDDFKLWAVIAALIIFQSIIGQMEGINEMNHQEAIERAREALKPHELEEVERLEAEIENAPEHIQIWAANKLMEMREARKNG